MPMYCRPGLATFILFGALSAAANQPSGTVRQPDELQPHSEAAEWKTLFDGRTFEGWEGDESVFRIQDECIVGGQTARRIPHNYFLATRERFEHFELQLEFRLVGDETNAGVQIRSERVPDHHEMIGYQADLGQTYWGCLYDESRRRTVLARPEKSVIDAALKPGEWNRYRIRCQGRRVQLWINDVQTVDYVEEDPNIPTDGHIALQIHGGPPGEAWYRHIRVCRLSER
jgi:hypothetical protein